MKQDNSSINDKIDKRIKNFLLFIKKWRIEQNLTQHELGIMVDVEDRTISCWERGKSIPDLSSFLKLCEMMNIPTIEEYNLRTQTKDEEEYEDFFLKSDENSCTNNITNYESEFCHSARMIYTDNPYAKKFVNKTGIFEYLLSQNDDDTKIFIFTVVLHRYKSIGDKIYQADEIKKLAKNRYHFVSKQYEYVFEMNKEIKQEVIDMYLLETHFPVFIRWVIPVADDFF